MAINYIATFTKDPQAVRSYTFNWALWLAADETISTSTVTVEAGLTKDSDTSDDTTVTVTLSGGTNGEDYTAASKITTSDGNTDERTMLIRVRER